MRRVLACLLLAGCGEIQGPDLPASSRLEYCGYDETPCEEPSPPSQETGSIRIEVVFCYTDGRVNHPICASIGL